MEVVAGVHTVDTLGNGRAYLVLDGTEVTLIDTGMRNSARRVLDALRTLGRPPAQVRRIVITHYHSDHVGSVAALAARTGAEVLVHALDAPVVRGERLPASPRFPRPFQLLIRRAVPLPVPVVVDRELVDGDELPVLGGLRVIHTPGHTAGSICLYSAERRLIFTGDAAMHLPLFGLRQPPRLLSEDSATARASLRRLADLDVAIACFGHGRPLTCDAGRRLRRLAQMDVGGAWPT